MYLINTTTLKLEHFIDQTHHKYAILSHRWSDGEVLYEDTSELPSCTKFGMTKLRGCCNIARNHDLDWVWIDTCCIDKKSSAELSEAINSMFAYYKHATICVVYLHDVAVTTNDAAFHRQFGASKWFTRCWTLQELIAPEPEALTFFNRDWKRLGTKGELAQLISQVTQIDLKALMGEQVTRYSVAERMSWATDREASREEDVAYSLMGLFDVNMPMLYGEGKKAFQRLQGEILKQTDDETLLAWEYDPDEQPNYASDLFAPHPRGFRSSRQLRATVLHPRRSSPILTNRGIEFEIWFKNVSYVTPKTQISPQRITIALLNAAFDTQEGQERYVGIFLRRCASSAPGYTRTPLKLNGKLIHRWIGEFDPYFTGLENPIILRANSSIVSLPRQTFGFAMDNLVRLAQQPTTKPFRPSSSVMREAMKSLFLNNNIVTKIDQDNLCTATEFHSVQMRESSLTLADGVHWADRNGPWSPKILSTSDDGSPGPVCNIPIEYPSGHISLLHLGITEKMEPVCIILGRCDIPHGCQLEHKHRYDALNANDESLASRSPYCVSGGVLALRLDYSNVTWTTFKSSRHFHHMLPLPDPAGLDSSAREDDPMLCKLSVSCQMESDNNGDGICAIRHETDALNTHGSRGTYYFYHIPETFCSEDPDMQLGWSLILLDQRVGCKSFWRVSLLHWQQPRITVTMNASHGKRVEKVSSISESMRYLIEKSLHDVFARTQDYKGHHLWANRAVGSCDKTWHKKRASR